MLFHKIQAMHIMYCVLTKEEKQMAFGNEGFEGCGGERRGIGAGIAAVVVIILLLIAMGIVF